MRAEPWEHPELRVGQNLGRRLRSVREVLGETRSSREERSSTRKDLLKANSGRSDRLLLL